MSLGDWPYRIGQGFDVHAFGAGDALVLGGIRIPYERGLIAHSDGDVLIHALCDALLGAAGLGDIGHHFPDTDASYRGIDSRILLRLCVDAIKTEGFEVVNVDATLIAQAPKMAPHIPAMRICLAEDMAIDPRHVNIKATTTERLGFTGRQEGIAAQCVALLARRYATISDTDAHPV